MTEIKHTKIMGRRDHCSPIQSFSVIIVELCKLNFQVVVTHKARPMFVGKSMLVQKCQTGHCGKVNYKRHGWAIYVVHNVPV